MERFHHEGRLAAQRAFLVVSSQNHPGANLVGNFRVVSEAMRKLATRTFDSYTTSDPDWNKNSGFDQRTDKARFWNGYLLEEECLKRMLSHYQDLYKR